MLPASGKHRPGAGKEQPVQLFTYRKNSAIGSDEIAEWEVALQLYKKHDFQAALDMVASLGESQPGFYPYTLYALRCRDYLVQLPPENWDGVFSHVYK